MHGVLARSKNKYRCGWVSQAKWSCMMNDRWSMIFAVGCYARHGLSKISNGILLLIPQVSSKLSKICIVLGGITSKLFQHHDKAHLSAEKHLRWGNWHFCSAVNEGSFRGFPNLILWSQHSIPNPFTATVSGRILSNPAKLSTSRRILSSTLLKLSLFFFTRITSIQS